MYRVAVVDDDDSAARIIEKCLNKYASEHSVEILVSHYENAENFLENYSSVFDVVFMDVELGGMNGIDAARKLRAFDELVLIVFVTNLPQLATKGYEVDALDYIIKPIKYNSFSVKIGKAFSILSKRTGFPIKVRVEEGFKILLSSEVSYIEVMNHDVIYHTTYGTVKAYGNLSEREKQLEKFNFARCSSCFLVNLKYVKGIYGDEVEVEGTRLAISRGKRKDFLQRINDYLGGRI